MSAWIKADSASKILDADADKPVLRGMFVQALFNTLSRGMDIVFVTTAKTDAEAKALLEAFGFPFRN